MNKNNIDSLERAKNYSFLLLKFRLRSEKEIYERLKRKKFNPEIIKKTISLLKENGVIDDNYFAKVWIESRIKKPLGIRRLKEELRLKGIDKEIIDTQLNEIKRSYTEEEIIKRIAEARFSKLKNIDSQKAKRRVFSYLVRRGFSPEIAMDVINEGRYN